MMDCLDDCCCPFPEKATWFAYWTLFCGLYTLLAHFLTNLIMSYYILICVSILSVIHILAGFCMLCGISHNKRGLYLTGLLLSWILPIFCIPALGFLYPLLFPIFFIPPLVSVQIIFFIPCIRWVVSDFKNE